MLLIVVPRTASSSSQFQTAKQILSIHSSAPGCPIGSFVPSYIRKEKYRPATPTSAAVYVTLRLLPLDSEMGWTGELWSKTKFLIFEN